MIEQMSNSAIVFVTRPEGGSSGLTCHNCNGMKSILVEWITSGPYQTQPSINRRKTEQNSAFGDPVDAVSWLKTPRGEGWYQLRSRAYWCPTCNGTGMVMRDMSESAISVNTGDLISTLVPA